MANVIQFTIKGNSESAIKAMEKMRASLTKIVKIGAVVGTALVAAFSFALKSIVSVGSQVENLQIRLNSLLGSTKEGSKAFEEMAKFAGTVPFAFDDIMESATALAGVVTGGADEISQMMPIIADLATVSGLSIQDTTSQVQRMMASGAASADMFRERGILSMLGFQAGVTVSAKETKERLIEAFESPTSKFAGAAKKMATTWDGVMSMIGDKWFAFRKNIADSGIFNYIKAIAIAFDKHIGDALMSSGATAKSWSDFMIGTLRNLMSAVGFFADMFQGLRAVWKGLEVVFSMFATGMYENILLVGNGIRDVANIIPTINIGKFETLEQILKSARTRTSELTEELSVLMTEGMPSEAISEFAGEVERTYEGLKDLALETVEETTEIMAIISENQKIWNDQQRQFLTEMKNGYTDFAKDFFKTMKTTIKSISNAVAESIVEGKGMAQAFQNIAKNVLKSLISMFVELAIKRMFFTETDKVSASREAQMSVGLAVANGTASWAKAPYPVNIGAPAFGAAMGAAAAGGAATVGAAHGGLTNVPNESTYLLQKGERVLSPNQNSDFTSFINGNDGDSGAGGSVNIESITIHVLENATSAQSLLDMSQEEMDEVVAGQIIESLDRLGRQGIKPEHAGE